MAKPHLEFFSVDSGAWAPVPGMEGLTQAVLATDPVSGIATRFLRFAPGSDTSAAGALTHDFCEEAYIISGELHDLTLGATFTAGMYACRPPGAPHGPWISPSGCTTLEVRYPA